MSEALSFVESYKSKGALFDANLLLVYVVGKCGKNRLLRYHHTKQYADDFPLIEKLADWFSTLYTTPNVLTEVSNLGKKGGVEFFDQLKRMVHVLDEGYCTSKEASLNIQFRKLGLTDSALLNLGPKFLVVTADFGLYSVLRSNKVDAVNFNHLRPYLWNWQQ
jgi:hypothetical protein